MHVACLVGEERRRLLSIPERVPEATVTVVATSREVGAIRAARERGLDWFVPGAESPDRTEVLRDDLADRGVELVCLDGWPGAVPEVAPTLSVTDSLAPDPGPDPVERALQTGLRVSGCTVRALDPDGTADPPALGVVTQEPVAVYTDDDAGDLQARIDRAVRQAYPRVVEWFLAGDLQLEDGVTLAGDDGGRFPARWLVSGDRERTLRYGENPHQAAALYRSPGEESGVVGARQRTESTKELSYNNYNDADAALGVVREFDRPAAVVVKHTNPAGCATADEVATAYERALATDPMSAYGGIVGLNRPCDRATAEAITDSFKEVVVAPGYTDGALELLARKESLRVLDVGSLPEPEDRSPAVVERPLTGGRLLQERDDHRLAPEDLEVVTEREPTDEQVDSMLFAWQTVKHVKSNAIVLSTGTETVGIGAGQVSRVDAVRLAARKGEEHAEGKSPEGAVLASDAFFPFPDGVERAAEAGVEAVVQPGGSVNDQDVIDAADDLGLAMAFTGTRAFRHD